jgi:hypothetical protein
VNILKTKASKRSAFKIATLAAMISASGHSANAAVIDTGNPDVQVTWDNTLKYSTATRLRSQDAALVSSSNADDGDRNFNKGVFSNRVDLLTELDVQFKDYGFRVSGSAWYDAAYNRSNDNPGTSGGAHPNQTSVPANQFTNKTRELQGRGSELLDAFAFTRFNVGDSQALVRIGQHGLVWGESLFFGSNAIAGAMAPVDVNKLISVPGTQFKEAIRPVPQVSGQIQLSPNVTLGGYYQFKFVPNRLPAVGSYFSQIDTNIDGAETMQLGALGTAYRWADLKAKNSGQGGIQLRVRDDQTDYGFYLVRFHDKSQQVVSVLGQNLLGFGPSVIPKNYFVTYQESITAIGASASQTVGAANFALEGSIRYNQDLASAGHAADTRNLGGSATNNSDNPGYPLGKTAHINASVIWTLDPNDFFNEANLLGEVAWNRVLSCSKNCDVYNPTTSKGWIDNNATRDAVALRFLFEPKYRQVLPGLDIGIPIGVGYSPKGSRSMALGAGAFPADGGGDFTIGINGAYLDGWNFSLAYTSYFGKAATFLDSNNSFSYGQSLKDRDFLSFFVRRTF